MDEDYIIQIKDISISFGSTCVLSDFSLSLKGGEKVILTGPNGSGKTTLLKAVLGNVKVNKGSILINRGVSIAYSRQGAPETKAPLSSFEVVSMGLYKSKNKDKSIVEDAMKRTGVYALSSRPFSLLSGGEKQRVCIAQCLVRNPSLILFDEPSSFLDSSFREEFISIVRELPSSVAVILVSHDEILINELGWPCVKMERRG